jgi:riboflavin transporter
MKKNSTKLIALIGVMTAISFILYFFEIPFWIAPYLKIDFSDVPAILVSLSLGPIAGIVIELLKNILHFMFISKDLVPLVGEFANFSAGVAFLLPVALLIRKNFKFKTYVPAFALATVLMAAIMIPINYFITIPIYFPSMASADKLTAIFTAITPFNLIKGIMISIVIALLYPRLKTFLRN